MVFIVYPIHSRSGWEQDDVIGHGHILLHMLKRTMARSQNSLHEIRYKFYSSSFFLGSTAQLRPWPSPQNPAKISEQF
jgi:hypothetical protein